MCLCSSNKALAQWTINSSSYLETNLSGYTHIVIDNSMGVNMSATPTLLLPVSPGSSTTTVYPMALNGTLALWQTTTDLERDIIGLSQNGGIGIYAGNDATTGAGLRLNAMTSATSGGSYGSVQTISYGASSSSTVGLQHLDYDPSGGGSTNSLLKLYTNGDMDVTGKLKLNFLGGDLAYRSIQGLSASYGLDIFTNTVAANGPSIHMTGTGNAAPSLMQFTAKGHLTGITTSFDFMTSTTAHALRINNDGNTRIGNAAAGPTSTDKLTLDGNLYMASPSGADGDRFIVAKSSLASLNVSSGSGIAMDGSDGACFTANSPGAATNGGAFMIKSYSKKVTSSSSCLPQLGFSYATYHPSPWLPCENGSGAHNIFLIHNQGQGIFGMNADLSYIHTFDVLSVKTSLGFWSDMGNPTMSIRGHAGDKLYIAAKDDYTNGGTIDLNATGSGEVNFFSQGTTGKSSTFYNYDGTSTHSNVIINNAGQTIVGKDVTTIASGDVLTVRDQLGMTNSTSDGSGWRSINGNANGGVLALHSRTSFNNGASIEMYGPLYPTSGSDIRAGRLNYISYFNSGTNPVCYGHKFMSYDQATSSLTNRMAITNDGRVIIGSGLIDDGITHAPNTAHSYNLYVQNGILTEMVRVSLSSTADWSDYVFAKNYSLMPLPKVEAYVVENHHLPDVPSAGEVVKDGIDLGKMDAKLLQKIEELTLYAIQQQKQIDNLQQQINRLIK